MSIKSFAVFLQEATPVKKKGRPKSTEYDLVDMKKQLDDLKGDKESIKELLMQFRKLNKPPVEKLIRDYIKQYDIGPLGQKGRPAGSVEDNEPEGKQPVHAFVILTDGDSNRFFLDKAATKFIRYNKDNVFSMFLGIASEIDDMNRGALNKLKIATLKKHSKAYDTFMDSEEDLAILDQFELQGQPAASFRSTDYEGEDN